MTKSNKRTAHSFRWSWEIKKMKQTYKIVLFFLWKKKIISWQRDPQVQSHPSSSEAEAQKRSSCGHLLCHVHLEDSCLQLSSKLDQFHKTDLVSAYPQESNQANSSLLCYHQLPLLLLLHTLSLLLVQSLLWEVMPSLLFLFNWFKMGRMITVLVMFYIYFYFIFWGDVMMKCEPLDWGLDCEWKELEVLVARALHRCLIFSTLGLLSIFFISSVFFFI